jgi:hypothetical protein
MVYLGHAPRARVLKDGFGMTDHQGIEGMFKGVDGTTDLGR